MAAKTQERQLAAGKQVARVLKEEGVEYMFGVGGGHITPLIVGFGIDAGVKLVHCRHEQAGGYAADGYAFTAPVDAFPPSAWELYNTSGNVAEWCQDTFHPSYTALSDFNPLFVDPAEPRRVVGRREGTEIRAIPTRRGPVTQPGAEDLPEVWSRLLGR